MSAMHPIIHADTLMASGLSAGSALSLAATTPPPTSGEPLTWVPWLGAVLGPAVILVVNRLLSAKAAGRRARAAYLAAEAEKDLADGTKDNDDAARTKLLNAAELRAEADALEALRPAATPRPGQ